MKRSSYPGGATAGRKHEQRAAFTLVELLVVITIIGMLMALLLPAVQAAREAGRRATCTNNEKQISLAMLNFDSAHNFLPGYKMPLLGGLNATTGRPNHYPVSWVVPILPDMGRKDLYDAFVAAANSGSGQIPPAVSLSIMVCPTDPPDDSSGNQNNASGSLANPSFLSYVVNRGRNGWNFTPAVGVCFDQYVQWEVKTPPASNPTNDPQLNPQPAKVSLNYLTTRDGATNTLLLAESLLTPIGCYGDAAKTAGTPPCLALLRPTGGGSSSEPGEQRLSTDPYPTPDTPGANKTFYYRPDCRWFDSFNVGGTTQQWPDAANPYAELTLGFDWSGLGNRAGAKVSDQIVSRHADLIIVSFCDGHQYTMRNDIDINTFRHMCTPDSAAALRMCNTAAPNGAGTNDGPQGVLDEGMTGQ
jgi:prepilin-type N-terminal cleavage/methylation domain-containing protein